MTPAGIARLQDDEGLRLKPYSDPVGKLTIGYGRNLDDGGISADEASLMLANDIARCEATLTHVPWFITLDPGRQDVIVNMAFNLGLNGLLGFHRMIQALADQNWQQAAAELLDSRAARELPERYYRLADALK